MQEETIKQFGGGITALINKQDLSRETTRSMFGEILRNEQPEMQQGAFLSSLTAKGETAAEIAGAWEAIYELDTVKVQPEVAGPLVDNCGSGMDTFKTFNISTTASIIAAAGGVTIARHGARAITSICGTVDMAEALGVDVECSTDIVKTSIERAGIGLFNGMSAQVHPQALGRILSQIRFGTTLNIAASLANPVLPKYGVRGVYSQNMVEPVAEVMKEIGYERALIVYGTAGEGLGMDELSTLGESYAAELDRNGVITTSVIRPETFGIGAADPAAITPTGDIGSETRRLLRILCGKDKGAGLDIACLNSAAVLYIAGMAESLKEGFDMSHDIVTSGLPLQKLEEWVACQNTDPKIGITRLHTLLADI